MSVTNVLLLLFVDDKSIRSYGDRFTLEVSLVPFCVFIFVGDECVIAFIADNKL